MAPPRFAATMPRNVWPSFPSIQRGQKRKKKNVSAVNTNRGERYASHARLIAPLRIRRVSSIVARRPILSPPPSLPLFNLEPENNRSFRDRNKKRRRASSLSPSFRCNRFRNEREKERLENKRTDQKVEIYSTWRSVSRRPRLASTNRFVSGRAINGVHARTERASDRSIERAGLNRALVSYKFSPSSIFIRPFSRNRFVSRDARGKISFLPPPRQKRVKEGEK